MENLKFRRCCLTIAYAAFTLCTLSNFGCSPDSRRTGRAAPKTSQTSSGPAVKGPDHTYAYRLFTSEMAQEILSERRLESVGIGERGCRLDLSLYYPWRLKPRPQLSVVSPPSEVTVGVEWVYWPGKPGTGENDVYGRRSKTTTFTDADVVGDFLALVAQVAEVPSLDPAGPVLAYSKSAEDNMLYALLEAFCTENSQASRDEVIVFSHQFSCNLKTDKVCAAIWATYEDKFLKRMKGRFPDIPEIGAFLGCPPIDRENPAHTCKGSRPAVPMTGPPPH